MQWITWAVIVQSVALILLVMALLDTYWDRYDKGRARGWDAGWSEGYQEGWEKCKAWLSAYGGVSEYDRKIIEGTKDGSQSTRFPGAETAFADDAKERLVADGVTGGGRPTAPDGEGSSETAAQGVETNLSERDAA